MVINAKTGSMRYSMTRPGPEATWSTYALRWIAWSASALSGRRAGEEICVIVIYKP